MLLVFFSYTKEEESTETEREERMWDDLNDLYMTEESEDEESGVVRQHHIHCILAIRRYIGQPYLASRKNCLNVCNYF